MALEEKLLIVVNPAASLQPAIDRTVNVAKARKADGAMPEVVLMFIVDHTSTDSRFDNESVYRDDQWVRDIVRPLEELGIKYSVRTSWSKDWADAIVYSANKLGVSAIVLSHPGKGAKRSFTDEFWYLVRNTPVPVCVVQSTRAPANRPVLIAMDVQDQEIIDLNLRILEAGKVAANAYGAELHFANAYQDSDHYPDRALISQKVGVDNDHIHLKAGSADEALAEISKELDPDLVIIGASRRTGIRAALRGRKLGDILMKIEHDLFVIV
jgi:universal stress protein E